MPSDGESPEGAALPIPIRSEDGAKGKGRDPNAAAAAQGAMPAADVPDEWELPKLRASFGFEVRMPCLNLVLSISLHHQQSAGHRADLLLRLPSSRW